VVGQGSIEQQLLNLAELKKEQEKQAVIRQLQEEMKAAQAKLRILGGNFAQGWMYGKSQMMSSSLPAAEAHVHCLAW